jgi:hypothetical protein
MPFLLADLEDCLGDPRSARPGSTSLPRSPEPLSPSRPLRGDDPCRVVLKCERQATKPPPILARRDPRASRRPDSRAAKRPALTPAAGRADMILSAPGEMSLCPTRKNEPGPEPSWYRTPLSPVAFSARAHASRRYNPPRPRLRKRSWPETSR